MSTMQNFHSRLFSEDETPDDYLLSLKQLAALVPAQVKAHASTLAWELWPTDTAVA